MNINELISMAEELKDMGLHELAGLLYLELGLFSDFEFIELP